MISIAAPTAVYSALSGLSPTPSPQPSPSGAGGAVAGAAGGFLHWLGQVTGIGGLGVLLVIGGGAWLVSQAPKGKGGSKAADVAIGKAGRGLAGMLHRFLTGRPLRARAAAAKVEKGGGWWAPAWRTGEPGRPVAEMRAVAMPAAQPIELPLERWYVALGSALGWLVGQAERLPRRAATVSFAALTVLGWALDTGRWLLRGLRGVWALVPGALRAARTYRTWRGAAVLALRGGLLVAVPLVWAAYAAHPDATVAAGTAAALLLAAAAFTGPAGHRWWSWPESLRYVPTDAQVYGPALWMDLSASAGLPAGAKQHQWLDLPPTLSGDDVQVRLLLPIAFRGSEMERMELTGALNVRLPGEWVGRWTLQGGQRDGDHYVTWTHKPRPKPKPECAEFIDFWDPRIQEAILAAGPRDVVIGIDALGRVVTKELAGDTSHWALSIGSGGGKSNLIQFIAAQLVYKGWTLLATDAKRNSVTCYSGLPGFYLYNDPMAISDMRAAATWFLEVCRARQFVAVRNPGIQMPGIAYILEEANETADLSRVWWKKNKTPKQPAADPFWENLASALRTARNVEGHVIGVFQDLRDDKTGNQGITSLFAEVLMGKFKEKQWDRIIGGKMPDIAGNNRAGRILVNVDGEQVWVQVPCTEDPADAPRQYRQWAEQARRHRPWSFGAAHLYEAPPTAREPEVPSMLRGTAHDPEAQPPAPVSLDKDAGQERDVTWLDGPHDAPHDTTEADLHAAVRRALEPRRPGHSIAIPPQPTTPPTAGQEPEELLSVAEIARRFAALGIPIKADKIRAHKTRPSYRDKFPKGVGPEGQEKYRASEVLAYFEAFEAGKNSR